MAFAFALRDATMPRRIEFDGAFQRGWIHFCHRLSNATRQVPRGFIRADSERALYLATAHALLALGDQMDGEKPRLQR